MSREGNFPEEGLRLEEEPLEGKMVQGRKLPGGRVAPGRRTIGGKDGTGCTVIQGYTGTQQTNI